MQISVFLLSFLFSLIANISIANAQENTAEYGYGEAEDVKGLELGVLAPDFSAIDQNGVEFTLSEALKKEVVVIMFYRGQWCPACNKQLSSIQEKIEEINAKGARLVAVSPEKPELIQATIEKTAAEFPLFYDEDYEISEAYQVLFLPKENQISSYDKIGANLKDAHSDNSKRLPVPATYIIDKSGKIVWKHVDADYKVRASAKEIMQHLP